MFIMCVHGNACWRLDVRYSGVISPAVQMVSAYQQTEALKYLTGHEEQIERKFVTFDLWQSTSFKMDLSRTKEKTCPTCGTARTYPYLHDQRKNRRSFADVTPFKLYQRI